jgi:hypothetical protein
LEEIKFQNFKISENNIISVELAKVTRVSEGFYVSFYFYTFLGARKHNDIAPPATRGNRNSSLVGGRFPKE